MDELDAVVSREDETVSTTSGSSAMSSKNTGSRIGGRVPVVLRRFCDFVFRVLKRGIRRGAYYFNGPHEELVCVENPVSEFVVEAMILWMNCTPADRVLALKPRDNNI